MSKAEYVKDQAARNTRFDHHCHWTGCTRQVPPAMWGCRAHWYKLPQRLRNAIWRAYRPGQELTKDPSVEYLKVAREVQDWIAQYERDQAERSLL